MSKRADDFQEQAEKYADDVWKEDADIEQKCITMTDYFAGAEYGYQYAVESVLAKVQELYPKAAAYYEQPEVFVEQIRKAMQ